MSPEKSCCVYCERTTDEVPLIPFEYQGKPYLICPQHLPVLIHKPAQLADKLPGLEKISGPEDAPQ